MNDDELREQLGRLDPMHPGVPVEPATTPSSRARMEQVMKTPLIDNQESSTPSTQPSTIGARGRRKWTVMAGVAAAAFVVVGGAAILADRGDDGGAEVVAGPPLELSLGDSDVTSSCMVFDAAILADMSPAFAGTAESVEGEIVTLSVDRWYTGGDAATVVLRGAAESPALIGGIEFEVGRQYLITAAEGNVNLCGYSGPASPELTAAFDAAFAS